MKGEYSFVRTSRGSGHEQRKSLSLAKGGRWSFMKEG